MPKSDKEIGAFFKNTSVNYEIEQIFEPIV